jgi:outer membrane usher protein
MLAVNVNIPFSHWLRSDSKSVWRHASASYSMSNDLNGRMTKPAGLYGTLLEDNNLSYSMQTGYAGGGRQQRRHRLRGAELPRRLRQRQRRLQPQRRHQTAVLRPERRRAGPRQRRHPEPADERHGGADQSPRRRQRESGKPDRGSTDWRGYAVLPYATEYRENRVALDTNSLADNVDLDDAVVSVVPTHGAIVARNLRPTSGSSC